jgi:hypothetical protein
MDLAWLLKGSDWFALIVAVALGYLAGCFVPAGWWSTYVSIFASYHLFLGWLLITAENKVDAELPLGYSLAVHAACLAALLLFGMGGRLFVRHFDAVEWGVCLLAFFERNWLFQPTRSAAPRAGDTVISSSEEYKEWLNYLSKRGPDPGSSEASRKEEFEWWLQARRSRRAAQSSDSMH